MSGLNQHTANVPTRKGPGVRIPLPPLTFLNMKKIAIDAYYQDGICHVVGGIFNKWKDEHVSKFIYADVKANSEYIPGQFYKRELPGILEIIKQIDLNEFETIIIDGYVHLLEPDNFSVFNGYSPSYIKKGLGMHLRKALEKYYESRKVGKRLEIVGIAKTLYGNENNIYGKCYRGDSKNPLYITSLNTYSGKYGKLLTTHSIIRCIKKMAGKYRIPTIIKEVDTETKKYRKQFYFLR